MSFVDVCETDEVPLGEMRSFLLDDRYVVVAHTAEGFFALLDECSHASVLLSEGELVENSVECFLHGSRFDLATGLPMNLPASQPVPAYPTRVVGRTIEADLANPVDPYADPSVLIANQES